VSAPLIARSIVVARGGARLLDGVSIEIERGHVTGLLGPNGAGKSTLLRVIAGVTAANAGEVLLDGRRVDTWRPAERAARIAYLPQLRDVAWRLRVADVVALGRLHLTGLGRLSDADREACERAMRETDVSHLRERDSRTLSGGELGRVLLARALATGAHTLLADEPTAGLDPRHQLDLMYVLRGKAATGAACCVVLHDLALAMRFCDRVVLLDRGALVAAGAPVDVLSDERLASVYGIRALRAAHAIVPVETVRGAPPSPRGDEPYSCE
jgi:iron complex transport system ATP-binding protein